MNKDFFEHLYDAIPEGKENAISLKDLSSVLGLEKRETKAQVLKARENGYMICSLASEQVGYFKPANMEEAIRCYLMFASRADTSQLVADGMKRFLIENGFNPDQPIRKKEEGE